MSQYEVIMPKLGESITEATITKWFKKENDVIEEDDDVTNVFHNMEMSDELMEELEK